MNQSDLIKPLFSWLMHLSDSGETAIIDDVQLSDDPAYPNKTKVLLKLSDGAFRFVVTPYIPELQRDSVRTSLLVAFSGGFEVAKAIRGVMLGVQGVRDYAESVHQPKH